MPRLLASAALASLLLAAPARAEVAQCHVVDVKFTPAIPTSTGGERHESSQIVAWVEDTQGSYKGTVFITAQTGRYGLGNRPGRWDFNAGPMFPYGRRISTFPVWAHRHKQGPLSDGSFNGVVFQNCCGTAAGPPESDDPAFCETLSNDPTNPDPGRRSDYLFCGENNLSHPFNESSRDPHFCQPYRPIDANWQLADAMTCATTAFTDKGKFSSTFTSLYPPRTDLTRTGPDSPSVDMYKAMNPFDAVSAATPAPGSPAEIHWPIPQDLPEGDYVMWVEVSQAFDHNATYSTTTYPAPSGTGPKAISWSDYGMPYRGQPSIVYKVPFTIGMTSTTASTVDYAGYGDPLGIDGNLRAPDATITTDTPGSGLGRLQLVSEGANMYRVLVTSRPEFDYALPGTPESAEPVSIGPTAATLRFIAPGDDGLVGSVSGYEVRYVVNRSLTAENFDDAPLAPIATVTPVAPGQLQTIDVMGLLPETPYEVGIRAYDDCHNSSELVVVKFTTADRPVGEVDACFVATAAYGSMMANDVEMLRHFRDSLMRRTVFGELAITTYYTFGPAVSGVVGESDLLRQAARALLHPLVEWVRTLSV
ncbi:MAG: fibronectin type III domain-containing protein [Kofleriaceae bacterium]|nr:fibronectin type III domain-containing protein [Kofleriaceae bacterium]